MEHIGFTLPTISDTHVHKLNNICRSCAGDIVRMTALACCGHPGGSLSSLHILVLLYACTRQDGLNPENPSRDRIVISHGHISPAVYSVLAAYGYFPREEALLDFRRAGTLFAGHVENTVPGVEWTTGNLGQGLSAGVGIALAAKLSGQDYRTIVMMGDGEQQKGQLSEARRFAVKYGLSNLMGIVDMNGMQIGGSIYEVMPQNVADEYASDGWNVLHVNSGHDFRELYRAVRKAYLRYVPSPDRPTIILVSTTIGKGVSYMEYDHFYHGRAPKMDQARRALGELGVVDNLSDLTRKRSEKTEGGTPGSVARQNRSIAVPVDVGSPKTYQPNGRIDCRTAYGHAVAELAELNNRNTAPKVVAFSCDLEESVKLNLFRHVSPRAFFESGIQEHHTATTAGAMSREGYLVFFSTFSVFAVSETYNQHRLNDLNRTNLKIVCTHCGLDVGEDGPTHQGIDYIGLARNLFGFKVFVPADANQTDRMIRVAARIEGNVLVAMGRSQVPVLTTRDGEVFYKDRPFHPGKADWVRTGKEVSIIAMGQMVSRAVQVADQLHEEQGLEIGVLNMASIVPMDHEAVVEAAQAPIVITYEDHSVRTGLGSLVAEEFVSAGVIPKRFIRLGVTSYGTSGTPDNLYREQGLHQDDLRQCILEACS